MSTLQNYIKAGQVEAALDAAKSKVRTHPADANERWMLFDVSLIAGKWESAGNQLEVLSSIDKDSSMTQMLLGKILMGEGIRASVFAGNLAPHFLGEPLPWMSHLVEALRLQAVREPLAAAELRQQAFEAAPATSGRVNGIPFNWLADADTRLGPVFEAYVNGAYVWVPQCHVKAITFVEPTTLRDLVWLKANFTLSNDGTTAALIPVRYPGTTEGGQDAQCFARQTDWTEVHGGGWHGLGQRMFATDEGDHPMLEIRSLQFTHES